MAAPVVVARGTAERPAWTPPAVPLRELAPWAVLGSLLMLLVLFFIGAEQGALSIFHGEFVHELVHDASHLLGFPCH